MKNMKNMKKMNLYQKSTILNEWVEFNIKNIKCKKFIEILQKLFDNNNDLFFSSEKEETIRWYQDKKNVFKNYLRNNSLKNHELLQKTLSIYKTLYVQIVILKKGRI